MAILIPFFQQYTGINVVMFYAPVLFKTIGFGANASLGSSLITGAISLLATFVSVYEIDKWGRRFLFLEGEIQLFVIQVLLGALIGWKFGVTAVVTNLPKWYAILVVILICTYVAGYAWSWGPLGWLIPNEIFPLEIRSAAQSIVVSVNMFFTFIVAQLFLTMLCHLKFGLFFFFAFLWRSCLFSSTSSCRGRKTSPLKRCLESGESTGFGRDTILKTDFKFNT
ncbi:hypothetical protein LWI29_028229 [Acer saccharum]|uniref:Major facilitator superfamily (MFS) profile domain-containing protein n=1 Tax=Acer saccharum TaxID=4024 RepID=A0AA39TIA0_ACESA|nr:hypothetical protein LWI29_028229 [Acer saccharum]